jgi:hypothetical protein
MRALNRASVGDLAKRLSPATVSTLKALYEAGAEPVMVTGSPARPPADNIVEKPRPKIRAPDIQQKLRRQIEAAKKLSAKRRPSPKHAGEIGRHFAVSTEHHGVVEIARSRLASPRERYGAALVRCDRRRPPLGVL